LSPGGCVTAVVPSTNVVPSELRIDWTSNNHRLSGWKSIFPEEFVVKKGGGGITCGT